MLSYRYSPFTKPLHDLMGDDLAVLRDVSEGWFVDYKSEPLAARDFAKHISAFGNQFGGWLFIGVAEGPDKNMKAGSFPGVPTIDVAKILVQIREAVSTHVSPPIYFDHQVIDGPIPTLGLESNRSVIVVGIPEGPNPPYVHSTGRIYRRIADSSDPKPETDRSVLDSMWRKSEESRTRLREFILKPTEKLDAEDTYCYLYLLTDLTFSLPGHDLKFAEFKDSMRTERPDEHSFRFDNIYSTQDGFIARHADMNDPLRELASLRWWSNGNVRVTIPINEVLVPAFRPIQDELLDRFLKAMRGQQESYKKILNLDQWLIRMVTMTGRFLDVRDKLRSTGPIYGKIVFSHTRSCVPFIGMESYLRSVEQNGIPVVQDEMTMSPAGADVNRVMPLEDLGGEYSTVRSLGLVSQLIVDGLKSFGVVFDTSNIDDYEIVRQLAAAMNRGAGWIKKR